MKMMAAFAINQMKKPKIQIASNRVERKRACQQSLAQGLNLQ